MKRLFLINCILTAIYFFLLAAAPTARYPASVDKQSVKNPDRLLVSVDVPPVAARAETGSNPPSGPITLPIANEDEIKTKKALEKAGASRFMAHAVVTVDYAYFLELFPNLTPQNRAQVMEFLYERGVAVRSRVAESLRGLGEPTSIADEKIKVIDAKISALCGQNVTTLLDLEGVFSLIRNGISLHMDFADIPLNREQERRLAGVMQSLSLDNNDPKYYDMLYKDAMRLRNADAELLGTSAAFLTPEQLQVLAAYSRELELNAINRQKPKQPPKR